MRSLRALVAASVLHWIPIAVALTTGCLATFGAVQQVLRQSANDPQTQIAEDAAARLDAGAAPGVVAGDGSPVDIATSLAVHITVVNTRGQVLASTARLDGATPTPPQGVLESARADGTDTVTWQPRQGVRVALVAVPFRSGSLGGGAGGGVVLAGRSLRAIENRTDDLLKEVAAGGTLGLGATLVACVAVEWARRRSSLLAPTA